MCTAIPAMSQRRPLAPDRVEDRLNVMHALLEREDLGTAVGHACATLVEKDDAAERGEAREECSVSRRLPHRFDVRNETRNEQQVERTFAEDLIGNVNVVALDVTGRGYCSHRFLHRASEAVPGRPS
jgi:hypothetical protein